MSLHLIYVTLPWKPSSRIPRLFEVTGARRFQVERSCVDGSGLVKDGAMVAVVAVSAGLLRRLPAASDRLRAAISSSIRPHQRLHRV